LFVFVLTRLRFHFCQHYLVGEYFTTAPTSMTPEVFYSKTKQEQADLIWKHLFIDRTPISEASRGVGGYIAFKNGSIVTSIHISYTPLPPLVTTDNSGCSRPVAGSTGS